eukprot:2982393-Amphidinium_carterae.1
MLEVAASLPLKGQRRGNSAALRGSGSYWHVNPCMQIAVRCVPRGLRVGQDRHICGYPCELRYGQW